MLRLINEENIAIDEGSRNISDKLILRNTLLYRAQAPIIRVHAYICEIITCNL